VYATLSLVILCVFCLFVTLPHDDHTKVSTVYDSVVCEYCI
jgi:hypothetical protein